MKEGKNQPVIEVQGEFGVKIAEKEGNPFFKNPSTLDAQAFKLTCGRGRGTWRKETSIKVPSSHRP